MIAELLRRGLRHGKSSVRTTVQNALKRRPDDAPPPAAPSATGQSPPAPMAPTPDAGKSERVSPADGLPILDIAPWPTVDFEKYGPVERIDRARLRRVAARNLARNWVMIPHVTHDEDADITELEAARRRLNAERSDGEVKLTMLAFLVTACATTLKEFPEFNAALDGDQLVLRHYYNIGIAADTPHGLVVPVIKRVDDKDVLAIARELAELAARARERKLRPDEMAGGTFTISSLGGIGGTSFTPIINAPEVAILGATRAAMKPIWNGSEFIPRLVLPLSLSYDHRVIDGAAAARFMVHLTRVLSAVLPPELDKYLQPN